MPKSHTGRRCSVGSALHLLLEKLGKGVFAAVADHEIDLGHFLQGLGKCLCLTAGDDRQGPWIRTAQFADELPVLPVGSRSHGTGVDDQHIRLGQSGRDLPALGRQSPFECGGVVLIDLAAQRKQFNGPGHSGRPLQR
jgi:hypothetical protein